jgi:ABC-type nitrate/sulfonate/bicarbonate transport system permease component
VHFSPSPLAVFAAFAFGIEAVVGYVLGMSNGLSELHKTVLVGFIVGFPILSLLTFVPLAARETRRAPAADPQDYAYPPSSDLQAAE